MTQSHIKSVENTLVVSAFLNENTNVHWLKNGANYIGRHDSNDIVYKGEGSASHAGILFLIEDTVLIRVAAGQKMFIKKKSVDNVFIFQKGISSVLEYCTHKFQIVKEGNKLGVLIFK